MNSDALYFVARETVWDDWYRVRSYKKYHPGPSVIVIWQGNDYKEAVKIAHRANVELRNAKDKATSN